MDKEKKVKESFTKGEYKKRSQFRYVCSRFYKNKLAMVGLVVLLCLLFTAVFCGAMFDYDADVVGMNIAARFTRPCAEHPFGTDQYGRSMLARIAFGTRYSLLTSLVIIGISATVGIILAALSSYFGGWVDNTIMRIMDVFYAIPFSLLSVCIVASLGGGMFNLGVACVVATIPGFTRVYRAAMMPVINQEYIEAAKACGTPTSRIILRHVIPNALGPIIVQATLNLAITILAIAGMSFIGLGIEPPLPEWGAMLSEGKAYMRDYPYLVLIPGLAIMVSALSLNLVGDGLRDALDPKLKK